MKSIKFLFESSQKDLRAKLTIEPLAPLSMVSTMPGNFYKTLDAPNKHHLCGAFENILGWHFDEICKNRKLSKKGKKENLRSQIKKQVDAYFLKKKLDKPKWEESEVGYEPLLGHLFDLGLVCKPAFFYYKDLFKQLRKRSDGTYSHPNGTMNMSYEIIPTKVDFMKKSMQAGKSKNDAISEFYKDNISRYPTYYSSAGSREFIAITEGSYQICLTMTEGLYIALESAFEENNLAYLGTNEGWVHFKIQKI